MEFGYHNSQNNNDDEENNSSLSASKSQEDEIEDLSQDLDLLSHPLFSFDKDPLLSILTKPIEALFDPLKEDKQEILYLAQQAFYDKLTELVYADKDTSELQEINLYNPSVCGRGINKNDLYFRCLDCDINPHPNMHSLLCTQCFENSNHQNHQLIIVKNTVDGTGTCDCGDADAFKSQGFCQDHQQKTVNIDEIYKNFPSDILTQYTSVLKKGIYAALSLFEIWSKATSETVKTFIWDLTSVITDHLFRFWLESFFEINKAFLPIFWTTLRTGFVAPFNLLWHDCQDLTPPGSNLKQDPTSCTCSLLENLLKISNIVPKDQQDMLESILVECIKDLDFREYLALKFMKCLQFMFNEDFTLMAEEEPDFNSRILIITIHLYQKEDMLLLAQNSPYFQNTLDLAKRVVEKGLQPTSAVMKAMEQLQSVFIYFLLPKFQSSTLLAKRPGFLSSLLDATMTFQMKFFYAGKIHISLHPHQIFFKSINLALMAARYLTRPLEMGIRLLFNLPEDEKNSALREILKQWEENLSTVKLALLDDKDISQQSFTPCLERTFTSIALSYLGDNITKEGLEQFLKAMLPNNSQQELSKNVLEGVLRALGMIRFAHLIHNYKHGEIWEIYYFVWNAFFETDITTIQLMALITEPESLFQILTENFFSYNPELLDFFAHPELPLSGPYPKRSLIVLEDFLNLLIYIMTDEISLLNTRIKAYRDCFGTLKFNSRDQRVIEKLLINLLQGHYWTDINKINETFEILVNTTQSQGSIIAKITVQDEKSHKVRIKDEYKAEFDPYTFYKDPALKQETLGVLASKAGQKDLISGYFDKDLPQHLKEIQQNMYQSSLTNFLGHFVKKFCPEVSPMLHPVLKLILLNLQVVLEQEEVAKETKIIHKIEENYLNSSDFMNRLDQLAAQEAYKDCEPCITKIQGLIKTLKGRLDSPGQTLIEDKDCPARKAIEEKKKLAQERMAKLKENFAAKQALFAEKNIENKQEESKSEEVEQKVCQHCMDKIYENGEEYGLPVYVTFTNNFYKKEEEKFLLKPQEYDENNILEIDWWPVVSSCNHYYHRKCFETLDKTQFSFCLNKWEAYCPLCKRLSNNFLCRNEKITKTSEEPKKSFTEKLGESFKGLLKSLNSQISLINLPPLNEAFFTRAYQYFIEGAYLLPSPQKLQQTFALYQLFFKTFKNHLNETDLLEEDLSLFSQLSSERKLEAIVTRLFSDNLQQILSGHLGSLKTLNSILKDVILVKLIQIMTSQETIQLSDCLSLYQTNQTFKQNIINQLTPLLQKVVLAFASNLSIMTSSISDQQISKFCSLFFEPSPTEEYLTNLLQCVGLESFPEFLNKIFSELKDRPQKELDFLNTILTSKAIAVLPTVRFSPMKFTFPETFAEFNTKYFPKKCSLCHQYSQHLFTAICMICGEIMCVSYCGNKPKGPGNLNMHARKFHMGMGIFLDIHRLYIRFVSCPLNVNYTQKNLYVDNIGQDALSVIDNMRSTELRVFDFKQFELNQELADEVNKAILQQGIRMETFAIAVKTNNKLSDGTL